MKQLCIIRVLLNGITNIMFEMQKSGCQEMNENIFENSRSNRCNILHLSLQILDTIDVLFRANRTGPKIRYCTFKYSTLGWPKELLFRQEKPWPYTALQSLTC